MGTGDDMDGIDIFKLALETVEQQDKFREAESRADALQQQKLSKKGKVSIIFPDGTEIDVDDYR
jgi:hypothetical protein